MKRSAVLATIIAIGLVFHADATDFYWIGGASSEWASGNNWSYENGGAAAGAYPNGDGDTALFPVGAAITLNSYANVRKVFTDGTLTLSENGAGGIRVNSNNNAAPLIIGGSGALRLAGVSINCPYTTSGRDYNTQITNNIEIVGGTTNYLRLATGSSRYGYAHVRGNLTGSGCLVVISGSSDSTYRSLFYGDLSGFTGSLVASVPHNRGVLFSGSLDQGCDLPSATLQIDEGCAAYISAKSGEFRIGELTGDGSLYVDSGTDGNELVLACGTKNSDFTSGVTLVRYTSSSSAASVRKVGTGTLDFQIVGCRNLYIDAGKVAMVTTGRIPSSNSPYIKFGGGSLTDGEGKALVDVSSLIKNSASPISIDIANNATFATQVGSSNVGGLVKRGTGTLTLSAVPAYSGTTVLENGTLIVPQGTTIAALSIIGGKLTVPFTGTEDETEVLTISSLAEGTTLEDLTAAVTVAGVAVSVESGASGYTVKATRAAQTFVWTGAQSAAWETGVNWTVGCVVASGAPLAIDTVSFPSALGDKTNVVLSSRATVAEVVADSDVALSGAQICSPVYRGEGKLILGENAGFYVNAATVVSNALEIVGDVAVTPSTTYIATRFYGDLTGSGTLTLGGTRAAYELAGDNSGFSGSIVAEKDSVDRKNFYLSSETAASENARWTVYSSGGGNEGFLHFKDKTVKFGSLNGNLYFSQMEYARNVLEVGALGEDMEIGGKFCYADGNERVRGNGNDIRKVGAGNLTLKARWVRNTIIQEGMVTLADGTNSVHQEVRYTFNGGMMAITGTNEFGENADFADVSPLIVDSSAPICFSNGVNEVHTWATALAASNVGGLTKLGAGTLTLSAAPLYTGWTTVKAGKLIVPTGTALDVVVGAGGEIAGATINDLKFADGYTLAAGSERFTATGTADVSNLTVYIANPTALGSSFSVITAGNISGTATLAFPEGTSERIKNRWSLKASNGVLKASSVAPLVIRIR